MIGVHAIILSVWHNARTQTVSYRPIECPYFLWLWNIRGKYLEWLRATNTKRHNGQIHGESKIHYQVFRHNFRNILIFYWQSSENLQ